MNSLDNFARQLDDAAHQGRELAQIDPDNKLSMEDAYAIQKRSVGLRLARGERRVGVKMGFTSRAKMVQMGLSDVVWGRLTDAMQEEEGGDVNFSRYVHPRVEPEVAFILKKPLAGRVTPAEALAAVEAVAPALEIIDSRYRDFKFTLPEVVADNCSSSGFVVGPWHDPRTDVANLGLVVSIDGRPVQIGSTASLLGHPVRSLVAAARLSAAAGEPLQAGWIVLAGGATAAEWIRPGQHVCIEMQRLGSASFHVGEQAA
ncbi:2-keto-4-pentenoate hydratase [Ramlibacter sp.]|uniref:2-keto-4-pentenoate hydratase n=1 Tax=Ramlibacter sp. TaxID=1917967 RepID=UPI003D0CCD69